MIQPIVPPSPALPKAKVPEILAPVGSRESLVAAVATGADAIYFGLKEFNARHRAANFELAELPEMMRYLHRHGVRGYLTFNTLIFSSELEAAASCLAQAAKAGIDAVIVQDWGIVRLLRKMLPGLPIHGSTQMSLTEPRGIRMVESWGVERVVVARELSLGDIRKITETIDTPLEVFVHGALCVAYSGQCLTSEALGGRSANRGQCAQACRLPYQMLVDGEPRDLGDKAYLLSPLDLDARHLVGDLSDLGVVSLKIEGRLKGAEYVASTVEAYRSACRRVQSKLPYEASLPETRDLKLAFSRGFVPGFLEGVNHQRLVQGRFPKARGVFVGELATIQGSSFLVRLAKEDPDLGTGDGIVFDLSRPDTKEPGGRIRSLYRRGDGLLEMRLDAPGTSSWNLPPGTRIWKTDDPRFRERIHKRIGNLAESMNERQDLRPQLDFTLSGTAGGALTLTGRTEDGVEASALWEGPLEVAKQKLAKETATKSLGRLGDSLFRLGQLHLNLSENLFLPQSQLNRMRREVVEQLTQGPCGPMSGFDERGMSKLLDEVAARRDEAQRARTDIPSGPASPKIAVLLRNADQIRAMLELPESARPDLIWLDMEHPKDLRAVLDEPDFQALPLGIAGQRVIKPGEDGLIKGILGNGERPLLVRNLATWEIARERGIQDLVGDFSLNIANPLAGDLFLSGGMKRVVPAHDLHFAEWSKLAEAIGAFRLEAVVHFPMPMFHMEHCVYAAFLSQGKDYTDCGRPCEEHRVRLKDRAGSEFPVWVDAGCRNTVYNEVAQSALEFIPPMRRLGVEWFRLEFLHEPAKQVVSLLAAYRQVISGQKDPRSAWREVKANHQFGLTRGTLRLL